MEFIDLAVQQERIRDELERRIARVLDHGQYILGPEVEELESALQDFTGSPNCISCASGTDALLLPLLAFGLTSSDVVFVPAFTFAATAEVVAIAGGSPYFVDVDAETGNLCPISLKRAIFEAIEQNLSPRGVIAVGLFGNPPDFDPIEAICDENRLFLIDDAAQSLGSSYRGRRTGSISKVTATSFFPSKPLGCYGDGGAVFVEDPDLADELRSLRVHGKGPTKYQNERVGLNSRLDSIQAAVLLAKLTVFEDELSRRCKLAERYLASLPDSVVPLSLTAQSDSAWALFTVKSDNRDKLIARLQKVNIPYAIYYPFALTSLEAFQNYPKVSAGLDVAEILADSVISLPFHPYLNDCDQQLVLEALVG